MYFIKSKQQSLTVLVDKKKSVNQPAKNGYLSSRGINPFFLSIRFAFLRKILKHSMHRSTLPMNHFRMEFMNYLPFISLTYLCRLHLALLNFIVSRKYCELFLTLKSNNTWYSLKRPPFLQALSFECTSKRCINVINQV